MRPNKTASQRTILGGSFTALMLFSANALAKPPAETTLDVKATLTPAMTVSCSQALDFGEVFTPTGNEDGSYNITMSPSDGSVSTPGAVSTGGSAQRGKCTVSDSVDNGTLTIDLKSGSTSLGTDGSTLPALTLGQIDVYPELDSTQISASASDEVFFIGGKLEVLKSLGPENYKDYSGTITVMVTDDT